MLKHTQLVTLLMQNPYYDIGCSHAQLSAPPIIRVYWYCWALLLIKLDAPQLASDPVQKGM
jgi:hypothetical protein